MISVVSMLSHKVQGKDISQKALKMEKSDLGFQ